MGTDLTVTVRSAATAVSEGETRVHGVQVILLLVIAATFVAAIAQRLRLPAPSLLVAVGAAVALLPGAPEVHVDPQLISFVVLPPLLYAAGAELSWPDLRQTWRPVAVLSVGLVLASAAAVAAVTTLVTHIPVVLGFLLGAVLASTDPVAVTALGRRLALPQRMQVLVQAESLFNDATSLILFRIAVVVAVAGGQLSVRATAIEFLHLAGGGVLTGLAVTAAVALIRLRTDDSVLETVIIVVAPYAAYASAEAWGSSGVTAVVVTGVAVGVLGPRLSTATSRLHADAVQTTTVFVLESVIFALIGLTFPGLVHRLSAADQPWLLAGFAVTAVLLTVRIAWVFPLAFLRRWRGDGNGPRAGLWRRRGDGNGPRADLWRAPAVLSWAGARGVVPLAAALSIPLTDAAGAPVPFRDLLQAIAATVIVISLLVQGSTLAPLVRLTGLAVPTHTHQDQLTQVRLRLTETALEYVENRVDTESIPTVVAERVRRSLQAQAAAPDSIDQQYRQLRREVVAAQRAELHRLHATGQATDPVRRQLERQLDLEDARHNSAG